MPSVAQKQRLMGTALGVAIEAAAKRIPDPVDWAREYMRTERRLPLDFEAHSYLAQPLRDDHKRKGLMCASQVGKTTLAISNVLHFCDMHQARVIFTMHTDGECQKFSATRAKPAIEASPYLRERITGIDNVGVKTFAGTRGESVIFFKGATVGTQALSEPADMLVHDELDFSRPDTLSLYEDRTAASAHDRRLVEGTPTLPKFGLDALWQDSSRSEWMVKCPVCGDEAPLTWPESFAVDAEVPYYICGRGHELTRETIQAGRWADTRDNYTWRMYHIPRMLRPNWPADRWMTAFERRYAEFPQLAVNQMLGQAATSGETELDEAVITAAMLDYPPSERSEEPCFAGCDQSSAKGQHRVVIGQIDVEGEFAYVHAEICDWDRLAQLMKLFNVEQLVIDALPETTMAQALAKQFPRRVLLAWYPNMPVKSDEPIRLNRKESKVDLDRTATLDQSARRVRLQQDSFCAMPQKLRQTFVAEMTNMVRGIEMDAHGQPCAYWQEVGPDHFRHAHNYATVAGLIEVGRSRGGYIGLDLSGALAGEHEVELKDAKTGKKEKRRIRPGYMPVPDGVLPGSARKIQLP